jgi:hypothetical protein
VTTTISGKGDTFSCIGVARLDSGLARLDSEIASVESASERTVGERSSGRIRRLIRLRSYTQAEERTIPTCG